MPQGTQQQLADSESAKDRLEQTVSGHATQISDLKEELAAATTDKDAVDVMLGKIRAEAMQKGNDLSKIKSGAKACLMLSISLLYSCMLRVHLCTYTASVGIQHLCL